VVAIGSYWGLAWLFSVAVAAWARGSPGRLNGAALVGLPVLMVVLWLLGVVLIIPTALIIRRIVRPASSAA
jgi:hypothetical protein